ncbi:NAD(P)-dependent oxidoreductase [Pseudonocardia kunmingensis]|uniref:3-hydroxyisobutyrate dehydrogenase/putative dehydrogenase n=1 Tax=Pseudonocardia kunmingensis TaxID=630975 RepID=A0A543DZE4_9PSEU|nr:NAD(P)-dependent oxidoreductase [Pseudonocardia kunmingensis]TQM14654.1 3-hydroxyisobutyrate dehydrogenase/putative dehydrogenase [Pseudonocardia kunmingensis]
MTPKDVTFVGIGAIGLPMAGRLAAAGHRTTGVDPLPAALERAAAAGLSAVSRFPEAPRAEFVIVMVATPDQLAALVSEALAGDVGGQRWVVMSTVGPDAVRAEGERLRAAGASVLDVPVTGGVARAKAGELTMFASGPAADVAAARPVLEALGTVREVGGEIGEGQAIKVVNQHLCAVHIVAAAEALALADALGLDQEQVLSLVEQGAAGSFMLSDRGRRMLAGTDVEVASAVGIFVKDSGLVADAARAVAAETPLLDAARDRYLAAAEAGLTVRDDSRVIETYSGGRR